jgi:fibronectin type 3 domain-containing protein
VTATGGANQVTVSWPVVSGATSYNIYWSKTSGVTTATGTKIAGATSSYVQTGLTAGTAYYYIVTAVNVSGESPASAQATATTNAPPVIIPATPTGVTATGGTNQVSLSWTAVSGATSYNIYWSTTSGAGTGGTKIVTATNSYVQTGLAAGTTYYYVVTAANSAGASSASAQVSAATAAATIDGAALYTQYCYGCHGNLGPRTVTQITNAIATVSSMSKFRSTGSTPLSAAQIAAISAAM